MPKAQDGDNALKAFEDTITEEELANSLRAQYEGFKKEYQEAAKIAETFETNHHVVYLENYLSELPKAISMIKLPT